MTHVHGNPPVAPGVQPLSPEELSAAGLAPAAHGEPEDKFAKISKELGLDRGEAQGEKPAEPPPLDFLEHLCPRCGWDRRKTELTEVTDPDLVRFVESVVRDERFEKSYVLFGGKVAVTFRSLSVAEEDLAMNQTSLDVIRGVTAMTDAGYIYGRDQYRTLLSLKRVQRETLVWTAPDDWPSFLREFVETQKASEKDKDDRKTWLAYLPAYFGHNVLKNDPLRQACQRMFVRFDDLVRKCELRADDPDFYKAISPGGGSPN